MAQERKVVKRATWATWPLFDDGPVKYFGQIQEWTIDRVEFRTQTARCFHEHASREEATVCAEGLMSLGEG